MTPRPLLSALLLTLAFVSFISFRTSPKTQDNGSLSRAAAISTSGKGGGGGGGGSKKDNKPPQVYVTFPASGGVVSGVINVTADANDNVGVAGVQFYLDGNRLGDEDIIPLYGVSLDTTGYSNGSHTVTAVARDTSGNTKTSSGVSFTISNTVTDVTPPSVSITSPTNNSTVAGTINFTADATDNVGVAGVQFILDGVNIAPEDTIPAYGISLNTTGLSNSTHTLSAVARDTSGNTSVAQTVTITVANPVPDTTAPVVSVTSPNDGATLAGTINVTASASDNVGVLGVQFRLDGVNLGAEDQTPAYGVSWNTTTASNGTHILTAIARDAAGNYTTATNVTVTVLNGDFTAPTVSITSPTGGSTVSGAVNVTATATDNVGVAGVQFLLDGANLGAEDTVSAYGVSWDTTTASNGTHTLTARARDAAGNTTTSSSVTVTVSNGTNTVGTVTLPPGLSGGSLIFTEGFESGNLSQWDDGVDTTVQTVINNSTFAHGGSRYLDVTIPANSDGSWLYKFFMPGYDSMLVSGYVYFPTTYSGGLKLIGMSGSSINNQWSGIGQGGVCPTGTNFFSSQVSSIDTTSGVLGDLTFYTYYPGITPDSNGQCWGAYNNGSNTTYFQPVSLGLGAWHKVELYIKLNTPGSNDGAQYFWLDGVLKGQWTNLRLRDTTDLRLNVLKLPFGPLPQNVVRHLYWDDVSVVANPTYSGSGGATDTIAPSVSVTVPTSGATVSGLSVTETATASDNVGVSGVQFRLDGNNIGTEDTVAPYSISWNSTTASNGSHTITARARDAAGNITTSAPVSITVSNNAPDATAPTAPTNLSATAVSSSQINLTWTASTDNVGVTGYRIYRGGTQIATSATNSYSNTGLTASTAYTYTVAAYDAAGNLSSQSTSASATTQAGGGGGTGHVTTQANPTDAGSVILVQDNFDARTNFSGYATVGTMSLVTGRGGSGKAARFSYSPGSDDNLIETGFSASPDVWFTYWYRITPSGATPYSGRTGSGIKWFLPWRSVAPRYTCGTSLLTVAPGVPGYPTQPWEFGCHDNSSSAMPNPFAQNISKTPRFNTTNDGNWHQYTLHIVTGNSGYEQIWIDGTLVMDDYGLGWDHSAEGISLVQFPGLVVDGIPDSSWNFAIDVDDFYIWHR